MIRFMIGQAKIDAQPGKPARVVVDPALEHTAIDVTMGEWIKFCDVAGPEIGQLFFGSGWQRADRKCREGFHRELPLIKPSSGPAVLCQADLDVITSALIAQGYAGSCGQPSPEAQHLMDLERAFGHALFHCDAPIFEVSTLT